MGGGSKGGGKGGSAPGSGGLEKILKGQLDLQQQQFAREQPFYDISLNRAQFGQGFLPDVEQSIREPTLSPTYQLLANEGINTLRNNLAVTGSPSSGPGQLATGRFLAGLSGHQQDIANQNLFSAAGLGATQAPTSQALQLSPTISNTASQLAQLKFANANQPNPYAQFGSGLFGGLLGGIF